MFSKWMNTWVYEWMSWAGPIFIQPLLLNFICVTILFYHVGSFLPGSPPTAVSPCQPPCQTPQLSGSGHDRPFIYTWDWPLPRTSKCHCTVLSLIWLLATLWTEACQAPWPVGFSRQEYWSGLPFPPPGDLSNPGIKPMSPATSVLAGRFFTYRATWEGHPQCPWPFLISKWSRKCPLL